MNEFETNVDKKLIKYMYKEEIKEMKYYLDQEISNNCKIWKVKSPGSHDYPEMQY